MKQVLCILLVLSLIVPVVGADERPMTKAEAVAISSLQGKIDAAGVDWVAGQTSMSDLSKVERRRLGKAKILKDPSVVPLEAGYKVPYGTFDWRNKDGKNWVTPVKNQGSCGSCWAFGAVGAVEAKINIDNRNPNIDADLSEQHLVSRCCTNCGDCGGGYPTAALSYIQRTGIPNETCFEYSARNSACSPCTNWTDHVYQLERYNAVASNTDAFQWALRESGPMVVVLKAPDDWYYYRSGIYEPVNKVGWANHCVVLVGYSDPGGYWIVKNSWGSGWGEDGYARVKYGNLEQYNYGYIVVNTSTPAAPEISLSVPDVMCSDSCVLHLDLESDVPVAGAVVTLTYDASVVKATRVTRNASVAGMFVRSVRYTNRVMAIVAGDPIVEFPVTLFDIEFETVGGYGDCTPVVFSRAEVIGGEFMPAECATVNGSITIAVKGDLNTNGEVDLGDVAICHLIATGGLQATPYHLIVGDMNLDGRISIVDTWMLSKIVM